MTWQPPPRPDWVRAVNAGDVAPIADVARSRFDRDALLDEARAELGIDGHGIDGFGDDDFLEPLAVLLPALEEEAELTVARALDHPPLPVAAAPGARPHDRLRRAPTPRCATR